MGFELNFETNNHELIFFCVDGMMIDVAEAMRRVPMTGWLPPGPIPRPAGWEYIGREVRDMTAFEIISIFIGIPPPAIDREQQQHERSLKDKRQHLSCIVHADLRPFLVHPRGVRDRGG